MLQNAGLLTVKEVAARLSVSVRTVQKLIGLGSLKAVSVGTGPKRQAPRIAPPDLEAFIRERRTK